GTGLGLAIVKKIVEEHFATMAFVDRPGGGTIVRLSFDVTALEPLAIEDNDNPQDIDRSLIPELTRMRNG
ncbi:MAG: multi-sensor signal transduction histidine kinase, partial [Sphingomonas bacterium]|nr:multi-sensor signal transduction histidine kinase [Sphingomonas bacterium]